MDSIAQKMLDLFEDGKYWNKGLVRRDLGGKYSYCLEGAIGKIVHGDAYAFVKSQHIGLSNVARNFHNLLLDTVTEQFPICSDVISFNDAYGTTFDDIRMVLEKVALKEQEILGE